MAAMPETIGLIAGHPSWTRSRARRVVGQFEFPLLAGKRNGGGMARSSKQTFVVIDARALPDPKGTVALLQNSRIMTAFSC